jgi:GNAT superfamily N-acetyltransferase
MPLPELHFLPLSSDLDVSAFRCGHADLDEFLIEDSREYQEERLSVTHLAYIDSELVGFFTLVTDCIDVKQVAPEDGRRGYPYRKYPALKIARLATSSKYQRIGIGFLMLGEVLALTMNISKYVGWDFTRNSGSNEQPEDPPIRSICIWIITNCWRWNTDSVSTRPDSGPLLRMTWRRQCRRSGWRREETDGVKVPSNFLLVVMERSHPSTNPSSGG